VPVTCGFQRPSDHVEMMLDPGGGLFRSKAGDIKRQQFRHCRILQSVDREIAPKLGRVRQSFADALHALKAANDLISCSFKHDRHQGDIARHGKLDNAPPGFQLTRRVHTESIRHHEHLSGVTFLEACVRCLSNDVIQSPPIGIVETGTDYGDVMQKMIVNKSRAEMTSQDGANRFLAHARPSVQVYDHGLPKLEDRSGLARIRK
jgi:hypothetical protein